MKEIKISEVIGLIKSGYTRTPGDTRAAGNIKEHFELSHSELKELFEHPKLKGIKTKFPTLNIIDDTEEDSAESVTFTEPAVVESETAAIDEIFS